MLQVIVLMTTACAQYATSLNRTVGSGDSGFRAAYWERISGEPYKAQLETRYAMKPKTLIVGNAGVQPLVERRWKFRMGWG